MINISGQNATFLYILADLTNVVLVLKLFVVLNNVGTSVGLLMMERKKM